MIQLEQEEIDLLKERGFSIKTKFFGKEINWQTKKMSLSRLVDLSDVYIKMQVDENAMYSNDIGDVIAEQFKSVKMNAKKAAEALAIAVSDGFFTRKLIAWHFLRNINPKELKEYTEKLIKQSDYQNFTVSIILMNGNRITKPTVIEKNQMEKMKEKGLNPSTES